MTSIGRRNETTLSSVFALAALLMANAQPALATTARADDLDGLEVVRVHVPDAAAMKRLERTVHDIWTEHPEGDQIDALTSPAERAALEAGGFAYTVVVDDLATLLAAQFGGDRARAFSSQPSAQGADFFTRYHPYEEIVAYMQELVATNPRRASMVEVGTTVEGRTIHGLRITSRQRRKRNPTIVVWAAQHAREWVTTMIPPYLAASLLEGYRADRATKRLVDRVEWLLVPVVNVDGYAYTWSNPAGLARFWRKNRRDDGGGAVGVDLNRNWEKAWDDADCPRTPDPISGSLRECSSTDPISDLYRGPAAFSEPETQALRDYLLAHDDVFAVLDVHSFGQLIMWPNGFTADLTPDDPTFARLGSAMQAEVLETHGLTYRAGPLFSTIYPVRGGAIDWTYDHLGLVSFTFEVRPARATTPAESIVGFLAPADQILPVAEEITPAIRLLAASKAARNFRNRRQVKPDICGGTRRRCKYGR